MTEPTHDASGLLTDSFGRVHEEVEQLLGSASPTDLTFRPDDDANSAAWLIWHLTRVQDDHIAHAADTDQVWGPEWVERCGLPFDVSDTGYGHTAADVAAVQSSVEVLRDYHDRVHELTMAYFARVD